MQEVSGSIPLGSTTSSKRSAKAGLFCWVWLVHVGVVDVGFGVVSCRCPHSSFVSEAESAGYPSMLAPKPTAASRLRSCERIGRATKSAIGRYQPLRLLPRNLVKQRFQRDRVGQRDAVEDRRGVVADFQHQAAQPAFGFGQAILAMFVRVARRAGDQRQRPAGQADQVAIADVDRRYARADSRRRARAAKSAALRAPSPTGSRSGIWAGYSAPPQYPPAGPAPCPNDRQDAGTRGWYNGSFARAWRAYCDIFRLNSTCQDDISPRVDENHSGWHERGL